MKKIISFLKKNIFVISLCIILVVCDAFLTYYHPLLYCDSIHHDDFELTKIAHPEEVWDKVLFGNSAVTSGYLESESASGYIGLGLDYGTIEDLEKMLKGGHAKVGSDLVIALAWDALYDELDTDPTYEWHRKFYEPYLFFQRTRIADVWETGVENVLAGKEFFSHAWINDEKYAAYFGNASEEYIRERDKRLYDEYFVNGLGMYEENLAAIGRVFDFCEENGIRARVLWMPYNPNEAKPEAQVFTKEKTAEICEAYGVEFYDAEDLLEPEYIYDTGHISIDKGAAVFTERITPWLMEEE